MGKRTLRLIFLTTALVIIMRSIESVGAEELIFYGEAVSRVELEIPLFELKINYLNVWNIKLSCPYLDAVATCTWGKSRIHTNVFVSHSIMSAALDEKKARVNRLCNKLFEIAKSHFELRYANKPNEGCSLCLTPCHLNMNVHLRSLGESKIIAEWRCGTISYKDAFFE